MKVNLIKQDGKSVGWTIEGENEEEKRTLGSIRNLQFWGTGDTKIEYNGMMTDPGDEDYVLSLSWATKGYIEKKKQEMYRRIFDNENQEGEQL